jgi:hypothetical protein
MIGYVITRNSKILLKKSRPEEALTASTTPTLLQAATSSPVFNFFETPPPDRFIHIHST